MNRNYAEYAWEQAQALLAIDSPSGFTSRAAQWLQNAFTQLGFAASITTKGGILVDFGGADEAGGLLLEAHTDTLGGMVYGLPNQRFRPSSADQNRRHAGRKRRSGKRPHLHPGG